MDFLSIMEAARDNKDKAKHNSGAVLNTKLTAPIKVKKKVDTVAIKKRLEEEKKRLEEAKRRAEAKKKPPVTVADKYKHMVKNTASQKLKEAETKQKLKEKAKYEDKQHEQKHKQFMSKLERISKATEKRSESKPSSSLSIKPKATSSLSIKPDVKKKKLISAKTDFPKKKKLISAKPPAVAAPSFQDLMKMAERVAADPNAAVPSPKPGSQTKPASQNNEVRDRNGTHTNGKKLSKPTDRDSHKQSSADRQKDSKSNGDRKSKHSGQAAPDKSSQSSSSKKPDQGRQLPNSSDRSTNRNLAGNKRPADRNSANPPPNKMPALSEEARAKLAFKSGKRPLPPASRPGTSSPAQRPNNDLKQPPGANRKMALPQGKGAAKDNAKQEPIENKPSKVYDNSGGVSAWDRLMGNSNKAKDSKAKKKRQSRYIDSDEEDEDLDDFIDDGEDDIDYSAAIRDIFGYDKSRYRDEDFDDRSMVAGFADIMKEEVRSARLGREEDLRDMALEEMEKKRKLMRKKTKK